MRFSLTLKSQLLVFSLLLCLTSLLLTACGGSDSKVYDIAIHLSSASQQPKVDGFKEGMKKLGYVEGTNVRYHEITYAGALAPNNASDAKAKFEAFMAKDYNAIWASNQTAARAVKPLLNKRALVVAGMSDPVGGGLIQSISQPGENITGVDSFEYELEVDKLRWITKINPTVQTVYVLYFTAVPNMNAYLTLIRAEAAKLNLKLIEKPMDNSTGTDRDPLIFAPKMNAAEGQAVLFIGNAVLTSIGDTLKPIIEREKLIVAGGVPEHLRFGALFTYSPNLFELGRQSAPYMSKILTGASPATLAVSPPANLSLVLNQKLADQFGIKFSAPVLAAADEVVK
jgi:putative tryptophan/tyrosine transport system substrate-binding protein